MTTPKLQLAETANGQANYLLVNAALAALDQLVMPRVIDKDLATPPVSPANGAMYIVASSPTGDWSGKSGQLAWWLTAVNAWTFLAPGLGMVVQVLDELDALNVPLEYVYNGTAWSLRDTSAGAVSSVNGGNGAVIVPVPIIIACSDEITALTTGTAKVTFRMAYAFTLTGVRASLTTAQATGSILTVDINKNGTSVLSTKLTIDNAEKTSTTAATAAVISDSSLADDAEITIDIDQLGDGTAKGLKVTLIGYKPL